MNISDLDEQELFQILSHTVRRELLKALFELNFMTFSSITEKWNIKSGPLYHHLKVLGDLIYKNDTKEYRLTELGISVCEWFIRSDTGKITVKKIDSFTLFTNSLMRKIDDYSLRSLIFLVLVTIWGIVLIPSQNLLLFGGILFSIPSTGISLNMIQLLLSLAGFVIFLTPIYLIKRNTLNLMKITISYLLSQIIGYLFIISISLFYNNESFTLSIFIWIIVTIFNQSIFILVNIASMISYLGFSIEKSSIIILLNLIFQLLCVILFIVI